MFEFEKGFKVKHRKKENALKFSSRQAMLHLVYCHVSIVISSYQGHNDLFSPFINILGMTLILIGP